MALAVASTSEARDNPYDGTVVVTKPIGVSSGDLLVIVASTTTEAPSVTCTGFTESFAFGHDAGNANRDVGFSFLWRIADSSDVSASNYTVSGSVFAVYMFRITGWTSGNPVFTNGQFEKILNTGNVTNLSETVNLSLLSSQLLIVGFGSADEEYTTFSTPAVSPSNPTWTSLSNLQSENTLGTKFSSAFVAYSLRNETTAITSFSVNADQAGADTNSQIGFVACICEPTNATASNALLVNDSDFFSPLTGSTQTPTTDFQEIEPQFFTQSAIATNPTQWSKDTKPDTSWTSDTL